jgi:hypothetical protein
MESLTINGTEMVVMFGGCNQLGLPLNDLWVFRIDTFTWQVLQLEGSAPAPRLQHSGASIPSGERVFFFGGASQCSLGALRSQASFQDMWMIDTQSLRWVQLQVSGSSQPTARVLSTIFVADGYLLVIGGYEDVSWVIFFGKPILDMWRFTFDKDSHGNNLETGVWDMLSSNTATMGGPLLNAGSVNGFTHQLLGVMYTLALSLDDGVNMRLYALNLSNFQWRTVPTMNTPVARAFFANCVLKDGSLLIAAGRLQFTQIRYDVS